MKTLFIEAKADFDAEKVARQLKIGGTLGLVSTVQYAHKLNVLKKLLPKSVVAGSVIGCDASNAKKIMHKVDAFLFIGTGDFHPLQIALETGKEVYTVDPYVAIVRRIDASEIAQRKKQAKAAYVAFLHSARTGILVSTKKGQNRLKEAQKLKELISKEGKTSFIFLFDTLDFAQLDNFPDIECWINTSCPRIAVEDYKKFSRPVINIAELKSFFNLVR